MKIDLPAEGSRGVMALCRLSRDLGYKDPFNQMRNSDGSCVGDLMIFLEDNPGAIQAIYEWIENNHDEEDSIEGDGYESD